MRLFVAIELTAGSTAAIDDAVEPLRSRLHDACPALSIRWVPRANLHLTLARVKGATGAIGSVVTQVVRHAAALLATTRVGAVTLFLSQPSRRGYVYQPLMQVPLLR